VWGGQAELVKSAVTPSDWTYAKPIFESAYAALPDYIHTNPSGANLAEAKKLVAEAGAHGAKGTIWVYLAYDSQQAQAIQAAAAEIGLDVSVHLTTGAAYAAAYQSPPDKRPYDMNIGFTVPDIPDPANMMWLLWLSTSVNNYMGYANAGVDAAINRQFTITNGDTARARLLTQAQATVVTGQPQTPLVGPDVVLSLASHLGGYQVTSPQFQWDCQLIGSLSGS
jgi:ABC-type oligopeptide transport system substrate-binding subunit